MSNFNIISPVDGSVYGTRNYANQEQISQTLNKALKAKKEWANTDMETRFSIVQGWVLAFAKYQDELAKAVTMSMGRPLWQANEMGRVVETADHMINEARKTLKVEHPPSEDNIKRFIEPVPLGICLSICAWNYPVAMVASLITAPLYTGNVVIFKHAPQTAIIGDFINAAAKDAGLPEGILQALDMSHADTESLIQSSNIDLVQLIGSTRGGQAVYDAGRGTFTRYGLELGGKDPVYLRHDANIKLAVEDLIGCSFGNAGQSCCSVERLYVHEAIYDDFIERFKTAVETSVTLGHPIEEETLIGPVVNADAATRIRNVINNARDQGAKSLIDSQKYAVAKDGTAYVAPQVLIDVDHNMSIMRDELFGPVLPIMKVSGDQEAISLMNDSHYGLTGAIWTEDTDLGIALGHQIEAGTFYLNRCDHADMHLPWGGGKKMSGIGRSYGQAGMDELVTTKSYHIRTV